VGIITAFDAAFPPDTDPRIECVVGNIAEPGAVARAMAPTTRLVFHLAAVVSSAAEADFELGMRVNLHGTLAVLDAARALAKPPRVVYASSGAVFGGEMPASVDDDFTPLPRPPTARRNSSANTCSATTRAKASSTAARCACPPSSCGRGSRMRQRHRSGAASCASR
jgi:nucleoside-diphosphate-sugar epimerase